VSGALKGYEKLLVTPWCAAHFPPAPAGISALCSFYYLDAKQNVQGSTVAVAILLTRQRRQESQ
jgi:hypothetical protein